MSPPAGSRLESWNDSYKSVDSERNWTILDAVTAVARRRETTPAAVSLAWLLARPEVSSVILGARDLTQLKDNLAALDVKLAPEDVKELDGASKPDWAIPTASSARASPGRSPVLARGRRSSPVLVRGRRRIDTASDLR